MGDGTVDLGAGDVGVLNYAYALEQLEAAFYSQVLKTPYAGMSPGEQRILAQAPRPFDLSAYLRDWLAAAPKPRGSIRVAVDIDPQSFL